jgi:L-aminopeptidase/D-esterase-like protein
MTENCLRARDASTSFSAGLGSAPGILPPSPLNAITDVAGVRVGHFTPIEGDDIRTGVTAIPRAAEALPLERVGDHGSNSWRNT